MKLTPFNLKKTVRRVRRKISSEYTKVSRDGNFKSKSMLKLYEPSLKDIELDVSDIRLVDK